MKSDMIRMSLILVMSLFLITIATAAEICVSEREYTLAEDALFGKPNNAAQISKETETEATEETETWRERLFKAFLADAKVEEGEVHHIYLDPVSRRLHAGIGHLLTTAELKTWREGWQVSDAQIQKWFRADVDAVLVACESTFSDFETYPPPAQLAIVNFLFQLGTGAPAKFPRATKYLKARRWKDAALEWRYANVKARRDSKWYTETPQRCQRQIDRLTSLK